VQTCTVCGQSKDADAFGFRNKSQGMRHRACKACVAAYGRQHYAANRAEYVARNNRRSRRHTRALKPLVWAFLLAHPCVDCGQVDPLVLDFDHVDPANKRKTIYRLVHQAYSWDTVSAEIEKCQVRCANCHRRRTASQFAWAKLTFKSDTPPSAPLAANLTQLRVLARPSVPKPIANAATAATGLRICRWCGALKTEKDFYFRNRSAGQRQTICSECFVAYRREHYRLNREAYIARNARLIRERGRRWSRRLWEFLLEHPCIDCGEPDPLVLEFDHLDEALKSAVVGFLARGGYPWERIKSEVAKCEVRCATCHRRRTANQFAWPKLRVSAVVHTASD